ncbi:MAG: hypothetical protein ACOCUA_01000 [archaeon]
MLDTALIWIGFLVVIAVGAVGVAIRLYRDGEDPLAVPTETAVAAVSFAGALELGESNGFVAPVIGEALTWAFLLFAAGLIALELGRRWRAWGA